MRKIHSVCTNKNDTWIYGEFLWFLFSFLRISFCFGFRFQGQKQSSSNREQQKSSSVKASQLEILNTSRLGLVARMVGWSTRDKTRKTKICYFNSTLFIEYLNSAGDDDDDISHLYRISWKLIASSNHIFISNKAKEVNYYYWDFCMNLMVFVVYVKCRIYIHRLWLGTLVGGRWE